jgi:hypothetical protein
MTAENWILERALAAPKPRLEQKTDHDLKPQLDQPVLWLAHLHPLAMDHARTLRKALTMLAIPATT